MNMDSELQKHYALLLGIGSPWEVKTVELKLEQRKVEIELSWQWGAAAKCPECGRRKLRRLIGPGAAIVFKGSGFYETDHRSESYKKGAKAEKTAKTEKAEKPAKTEKPEKSGGSDTVKKSGE